MCNEQFSLTGTGDLFMKITGKHVVANNRHITRGKKEPLGGREIEEGDVDVLVWTVVCNKGRSLLHHKPLASIPQVTLKSKHFHL